LIGSAPDASPVFNGDHGKPLSRHADARLPITRRDFLTSLSQHCIFWQHGLATSSKAGDNGCEQSLATIREIF
jgi:hypothetical protein